MANKRMFSKKILQSDAFLNLSHSAQALYVQLNMEADDDGFINNPRTIMRMVGACEADLAALTAEKFIIDLQRVVVVKHWNINNYIPKDRYHATAYQDEKNLLTMDENGAYNSPGKKVTKRRQTVYKPYTDRQQNEDADKIRLDKNRIDKSSTGARLLETFEGEYETEMPEDLKVKIWPLFETFITSRIETKKSPSAEAVRLILKTLNDESRGNADIAKAMLEKAIRKGWMDVYPLDAEEKRKYMRRQEMPAPEPPKNPLSKEESEAAVKMAKERLAGIFGE